MYVNGDHTDATWNIIEGSITGKQFEKHWQTVVRE